MKSILTFIARFSLCAALLHSAHAKELVASIPGQLSVRQGAAVYTIPIEIPPGVAPGITDTQPDLAIAPTTAMAAMVCWGWGFPCRGFPPLPAAVKPSPRIG